MDKLKILEEIVSKIIRGNKYVISNLNETLVQGILDIKFSGLETCGCLCCSFHKEYIIDLGLKYIAELYGYCLGMYSTENANYDLSKIPNLYKLEDFPLNCRLLFTKDNCHPLASDVLFTSHFLDYPYDVFSTLTIFAYCYSVYHEIGHIIHNGEYTTEYDQEIAADTFAFKSAKMLFPVEYDGEGIVLFGVFLGVSQMLFMRTNENENTDLSHPHSVERIYFLLDYWGIADDSPYWELAYNIVKIWCGRNKESVTWERPTSICPKDKFIDAYVHFRKKLKQIE